MKVLIFEDGSHDNFYPIAQTRPLWDLRCGAFTMKARIEKILERLFGRVPAVKFRVRPQIAPLCSESGLSVNEKLAGDDYLFINALLAPHGMRFEKGSICMHGDRVAAAYLPASVMDRYLDRINSPAFDFSSLAEISELSKTEIPESSFLPSYIWDLVLKNGGMIINDYDLFDMSISRTPKYAVTFIGSQDQIYIEEDVRLDPFVCIDVTKGPVIISKNCEINSFTRIEGPCFIGEGSLLIGAKVREGCSFGPVCRVGGEVEDSIFQSYTNKYHDGFIGHAYIGEWVNLGALTTNSDLRNNYANVSCALPSGAVDTGSPKVGCFIGDFTRTSIGTLINTGSVIGTGSTIVFSGRMTPPLVPDFCRFIKNELRDPGEIDSIITTNRIAASRREKTVHEAMEKLLADIYSQRKEDRDAGIRKWNDALK
jgi:UDP-N-acetylglucosamine diphosphorylase / glucose-1-phosphate thymidylyltransferase / UDP-N-acetylgalactosamine diphosphorylase / glucosamine-1-phosphate N-acetyltransferase / galactosamine-1-phosphate N-acetyltransferase